MAQQTIQDIKDLAERYWDGGKYVGNDAEKEKWIKGFVTGFILAKSE